MSQPVIDFTDFMIAQPYYIKKWLRTKENPDKLSEEAFNNALTRKFNKLAEYFDTNNNNNNNNLIKYQPANEIKGDFVLTGPTEGHHTTVCTRSAYFYIKLNKPISLKLYSVRITGNESMHDIYSKVYAQKTLPKIIILKDITTIKIYAVDNNYNKQDEEIEFNGCYADNDYLYYINKPIEKYIQSNFPTKISDKISELRRTQANSLATTTQQQANRSRAMICENLRSRKENLQTENTANITKIAQLQAAIYENNDKIERIENEYNTNCREQSQSRGGAKKTMRYKKRAKKTRKQSTKK